MEPIHLPPLRAVAEIDRLGRALLIARGPLRPGAGPVPAVCAIAFAIGQPGCASTPGSIGAVLSQSNRDGTVVVRSVPSDLSGARAGLETGDEVVLIDGRDVRSMSPSAIHESLEGPVGSKVRLTVLRRGKVERLEIERGPLRETSGFVPAR